MTLKKLGYFLTFFWCQFLLAQTVSTHVLKEVIVSDSHLQRFSNSQSVLKLPDSIIRKNQAFLTHLLNYNSVIYFKENGLGMVASPSFRGTSAQQTAVIWNGININSQLNGQTDFNTITTKDFNAITVRAGGGSSLYGSSAIGGSIHLLNTLSFEKRFENTLQIGYGSFNTFGANYKIEFATEKISTQISLSRNSSENDYKYLDTNKKNENGQFYNTSFNLNLGYKINVSTLLKFYNQVFDSERHFSGTLAAPSKSKYQDFNTRSLLEWVATQNAFTSKLKVAYLTEKYKYFENAATSVFNDSSAKTFISKFDFEYKINPDISVNSILEYNQTKGFGSDIGNNTRQIGAGSALLKHQLSDAFLYEITVRKEVTANYKSPVLFSVGSAYSVTPFYKIKTNVSRNFRIPTFNDLYWQGNGTTDLKPESAYQVEIGNEFKGKNVTFSATGYYLKIQDLLRWSPGNNGVWSPNNVAKVTTYGGEFLGNYKNNFGTHFFDFTTTYGYTFSKDEKNDKQLIYVPNHKFTAALAYSYQKIAAHYQYLYNGEVFTSSDNFYSLDDYLVSNVGIDYDFGKKETLKLGVTVLNVFNKKYQSVAARPMPGLNYNMYLTFKF